MENYSLVGEVGGGREKRRLGALSPCVDFIRSQVLSGKGNSPGFVGPKLGPWSRVIWAATCLAIVLLLLWAIVV